MFNIIIFGPPGSGKGTQSEKIVEKYNLQHLSTGDLLRKEIKSGSELGKDISNLINNGELVPDEMVYQMVEAFILSNKDGNGFILDGFPRTTTQAQWLKELMEGNGTKINILLSLYVDDKALEDRLLARGKVSGRADDQDVSIIRNRIKVYHKQTQPVIDFYDKQGKLREVDGFGTFDEVFERVCNVIDI
jgi:adenylate kinase